MTSTTPGRGRRVLLIDPAAQAARGNSEGRLARLLIVGALASFLGFFGLAVISTPDTSGAGSQPAISGSAPAFFSRGNDDDDDDGGGWFSTGSDVRTKTS
ncbi:MAG TPA: hypothetical protein PKA95_00575 [Thermomicrobiales bacterium]|nr:hypothetical protein [Thermomicrobiales bacterium]